jgi:hypothetical protein
MDSVPFPMIDVNEGRHLRRRRSIAREVLGLMSSLCVVSLVCVGVYLGVTTNTPFQKAGNSDRPRSAKSRQQTSKRSPASRAEVQPEPVLPVAHLRPVTGREGAVVHASPSTRTPYKTGQADKLISQALRAAKEGMFARANNLAGEARHVCADHPAATGAWYLVAYAARYSELADEAITQLSSANDAVDLGPAYGCGAFIERNGDEYTFLCGGKKERFSIGELNVMQGVRFSITRQFLNNADFNANHLVLAAAHHFMDIDEKGLYSVESPEKCRAAAVELCERAMGREDEAAKHARHILLLFAWLESQPPADEVRPRDSVAQGLF